MDKVPNSVRVRTGDDNSWRYDAIEAASEFYDCNRSDAIAYACDDVPAVAEAVQEVLARDDLTRRQVREIAETFDSGARGLDVDVDEITIDVGP